VSDTEETGGERNGETVRIHFRVSEATRARILEAGDFFGFTSAGMAARHLMFLGLQVCQAQLGSRGSENTTRDFMQLFQRVAEEMSLAMAEASPQRASDLPMLDTTATSPDRQNGAARLK
jgi:hypothetical protein